MATGKHGLELPAAISASLFVLAGAFAGALAGLLYDLFSIVGSIEVDSNFTVQRLAPVRSSERRWRW